MFCRIYILSEICDSLLRLAEFEQGLAGYAVQFCTHIFVGRVVPEFLTGFSQCLPVVALNEFYRSQIHAGLICRSLGASGLTEETCGFLIIAPVESHFSKIEKSVRSCCLIPACRGKRVVGFRLAVAFERSDPHAVVALSGFIVRESGRLNSPVVSERVGIQRPGIVAVGNAFLRRYALRGKRVFGNKTAESVGRVGIASCSVEPPAFVVRGINPLRKIESAAVEHSKLIQSSGVIALPGHMASESECAGITGIVDLRACCNCCRRYRACYNQFFHLCQF